MSKRDTRTDAERVLAENMYNIYMSDIVKTQSDYESQLRQLVVDLEKNRQHKTIKYLKAIMEDHISYYATDKQVADYYRKRKTMSNRVPKYVKFCEELFKVDPDERIDYVDSTGESYGKVMEYLNKYRNCHRVYSHLVDEFYDKYSLLMEERRQKEADERIRKNFKEACRFFDEEIIAKGHYSISDYVDYVDEKEKRKMRSFADGRRKIIANRDSDVWKCYVRKMEVNRTNTYLMLKDNIDSFVGKMVNGYLNNDPVDIIDYFMEVGISFKKFKEICDGHLSTSSISLFNIFTTPYMNVDNNYEIDDYFKINYTNSETGKSASEDEKICVYEFLKHNNIPDVYFPVALNKYLKGDLDIKFKSLKKEF